MEAKLGTQLGTVVDRRLDPSIHDAISNARIRVSQTTGAIRLIARIHGRHLHAGFLRRLVNLGHPVAHVCGIGVQGIELVVGARLHVSQT